jgi:hypothetical protein
MNLCSSSSQTFLESALPEKRSTEENIRASKDINWTRLSAGTMMTPSYAPIQVDSADVVDQ